MKTCHLMKDDVLTQKAVAVLMEKLGPIETSRFLAMDRSKRMESVKRHRRWQNSLDQQMFVNEVFSQ